MNAAPRITRLPAAVLAAALATVLLVGALAAPAVAQDDPQEQMMRGQLALDRDEYRKAASAFNRAAAQSKATAREAEALYWYAFALHRAGAKNDLRKAAEALVELQDLEMNSALYAEALDLAVRVKSDLARQGDAKAAQELAEMVAKQEDLKLKLTALRGMVNVNPEKAYVALERIVRDREPGSAELRSQAVYLLAQLHVEGTEDLLVDLARNDPDPEVRHQAVVALSQIGSAKSIDVLIQLVNDAEDLEVKTRAVFALSHQGGDRAAQALRNVAADPKQSHENRAVAIYWLGQEGGRENGDEHLAYLRGLYEQLDDPELKQQLLLGVARSETPATGEWLAEIALDSQEDLEARTMALHWAGQQGHLPVAKLRELYRGVPEQEMREQVIYVLAHDGSDEAVQELITIAREEQDLELRQMAVFWIGEIGGDEAEQFLLEILNR